MISNDLPAVGKVGNQMVQIEIWRESKKKPRRANLRGFESDQTSAISFCRPCCVDVTAPARRRLATARDVLDSDQPRRWASSRLDVAPLKASASVTGQGVMSTAVASITLLRRRRLDPAGANNPATTSSKLQPSSRLAAVTSGRTVRYCSGVITPNAARLMRSADGSTTRGAPRAARAVSAASSFVRR